MEHDVRKRKACQTCMRAKAKCSPSQNDPDTCYRCDRLNKECWFAESAKKKASRPRSRVKQLEQRVESLIDFISTSHRPANPESSTSTSTAEAVSPDNDPISQAPLTTVGRSYNNELLETSKSEAYDPIKLGLLDRGRAGSLLKGFRTSFTHSYPFVIVPATTDLDTFRRRNPFLFHAIMAVMTFSTPILQRRLSDDFMAQVSDQIILKCHKSMEILQGLLVYSAWYHFFYRPEAQQIGNLLQLAVSMTQDLGLTKRPNGLVRSERSAAEKRALLGTYFLNVTQAQVWRKRTTMSFTKFMEKCIDSFAEDPDEPTDVFIAPLVQLSNLTVRIGDQFSYDDIENAEFNGEIMIETLTSNFVSELMRIKQASAKLIKENISLELKFCHVEMWIHECSLHSSLWHSSSLSSNAPISVVRLKLLYRSMSSMKEYLTTMLVIPQESLYHLNFSVWAGWFYGVILGCRLVFLQGNEQDRHTCWESLPGEITKMLPDEMSLQIAKEPAFPDVRHSLSTWDPISVARESEVVHLFTSFTEKLSFASKMSGDPWTNGEMNCADKDALLSFLWCQRCILIGFNKRIQEYTMRPTLTSFDENIQIPTGSLQQRSSTRSEPMSLDTGIIGDTIPNIQPGTVAMCPDQMYSQHQKQGHPIPFFETLNFQTLNFETIQVPTTTAQQQLSYDDIAWDMLLEGAGIPQM